MSEQFTFEDMPTNDAFDAYSVTTRYNEANRDDMRDLSDFSKAILSNGPLANYSVLIPVAAHQEAASIYKTLSLYANQESHQPFDVVLSMNYPNDADTTAVAASFDELERAKHDFPNLTVHHFEANYIDPTIGGIRADLWDATLLAAEDGGTITPQQDMICFNHDIDLEKLPRTYIDSIQTVFEMRTAQSRRRLKSLDLITDEAPIIRPVFGNMKHAADTLHPNISRAALWYDAMVKLRDGGFEAGLVIPMGAYARSGGFSADDTQSEAINMLDRYSQTTFPDLIRLPAAETSSRRLVEKLGHQNATFSEIWSDNSFAVTEAYRDTTNSFRDISEDEMHLLVARDFEHLVQNIGVGAIKSVMRSEIRYDIFKVQGNLFANDPEPSDEVIIDKANRMLENGVDYRAAIARMILTRVIKHPLSKPAVDYARGEAIREFKIIL